MLEPKAIRTMLEAGATFADVARQQGASLTDVHNFCRDNDLKEPTPLTLSHIRKLAAAQHPQGAVDWERLIADDGTGNRINGIDTATSNGNVNAQEIIAYYHGECRCIYSNEQTDNVMAADGNPQNLLVSNLVPVTKEVLDQRFRDTYVALNDVTYRYGQFTVSLTVQHRFDKVLGTGFNRLLIDASMEQWIEPYGDYAPRDILAAYGLPGTPDLMAMWVWRKLEKRALIKGMARVKVERDTWYTAYLTKQQVLDHTKQMLARQFGQRSVMTAEPAVMPPPGHGSAPSRLIKL